MEKSRKMQFYFLGKDYGSNPPKSNTFKAYKYKDKETKETTLYPIKNENDKNIFIHGIGTKKIAPTKVIEVPVFDMIAEHWDEYREKYGDYCLYYSIDGSDLDDWDCCSQNKRNEYKSILETGTAKYVEFINCFMQLSAKQSDIIKNKYLPLIQEHTCFCEEKLIDEYLFRPQYYLLYTFFNTSAMPDVINDDKRMEKLYKDYRSAVLKNQNEDYKKYRELLSESLNIKKEWKKEHPNQIFDYCNVSKELYREYENLLDESDTYYMKADKIIKEILDKEINTDNDIFPTSVKDRVKFLFGEEVSNMYNELVDKFITI